MTLYYSFFILSLCKCLGRSDFITAESITESTAKIYYDNFGALTWNEHGEPEEEPSM